MTNITLVVQSDDFGMCHSVNTGVVEAFTNGILTQASVMVPCPWFDEAAELALAHRIPVGVHCTLTAEWDHLRYRPLTAGPGLRGPDGTFHRTIEAARESVSDQESIDELVAQTDRFIAARLEPSYFDCHMGLVRRSGYEHVCATYGKKFIYPMGGHEFPFTSRASLSAREPDDKLPWLLNHLESLEDGVHIVVTHCAEPSDELDSLARRDAANYPWTQPFRVTDLEGVTSKQARAVIERRGIKLASVADLT